MNILIIGCNRTGSLLARRFQDDGHDVAVVDQDPLRLRAFAQEGGFHGLSFCGLPIDVDTLRAGGIENSDAVFALTDDDTVNIMVAQIAQEQYRIGHVWAKIMDPALKAAYGTCFSIWTVCPAELTADSLYHSFLGTGRGESIAFGNDSLYVEAVRIPRAFTGRTFGELLHSQNGTVLGLLHADGETVLTAQASQEVLLPDDSLLLVTRQTLENV